MLTEMFLMRKRKAHKLVTPVFHSLLICEIKPVDYLEPGSSSIYEPFIYYQPQFTVFAGITGFNEIFVR